MTEYETQSLAKLDDIAAVAHSVGQGTTAAAIACCAVAGMFLWRVIVLGKNQSRFWSVLLAAAAISAGEASAGEWTPETAAQWYGADGVAAHSAFPGEVTCVWDLRHSSESSHRMWVHASAGGYGWSWSEFLGPGEHPLTEAALRELAGERAAVAGLSERAWFRVAASLPLPVHEGTGSGTGHPLQSHAPGSGPANTVQAVWAGFSLADYAAGGDGFPDSDGDGVTDELDLCPFAPADDCTATDQDGDGCEDANDETPQLPGGVCTCPGDADCDGTRNGADLDYDSDGDGQANGSDPCPLHPANDCNAPPTASGWTLSSEGWWISGTLSEAGMTPAAGVGSGGFDVSGPIGVTGWYIDGTTIVLYLDGTFSSLDRPVLYYSPPAGSGGSLSDADGDGCCDMCDLQPNHPNPAGSLCINYGPCAGSNACDSESGGFVDADGNPLGPFSTALGGGSKSMWCPYPELPNCGLPPPPPPPPPCYPPGVGGCPCPAGGGGPGGCGPPPPPPPCSSDLDGDGVADCNDCDPDGADFCCQDENRNGIDDCAEGTDRACQCWNSFLSRYITCEVGVEAGWLADTDGDGCLEDITEDGGGGVWQCPCPCVDDPETEEDECGDEPCVDDPNTTEDDCCEDDPTTPIDECELAPKNRTCCNLSIDHLYARFSEIMEKLGLPVPVANRAGGGGFDIEEPGWELKVPLVNVATGEPIAPDSTLTIDGDFSDIGPGGQVIENFRMALRLFLGWLIGLGTVWRCLRVINWAG